MKAIPRLERDEFHVIGKPLAKEGEQLLKEERRGDDRRAGVVAEAAAFEDLGAASQTGAAVDQRDLVALGAEPERRRDASETCANDQCPHEDFSAELKALCQRHR